MNAADQFEVAMHTPGPWEAINNFVRAPMVHPPATERIPGQILVECSDGHGLKANSQEASANARLIAAAPEMLVALRELINEVQPLGIDRATYQFALAAMFKAVGAAS